MGASDSRPLGSDFEYLPDGSVGMGRVVVSPAGLISAREFDRLPEHDPLRDECDEGWVPSWLRPLDSVGSVRATDAPVEAICWTHRGSGWDVHYTAEHQYASADLPDGVGVSTKREAYAAVRRLRDAWHRADRLRLMNDPSSWD